MATVSHVRRWAETYEDVSELWDQLDGIMDELNVEQLVFEHTPPARRHRVDRMHHLVWRIGELFEELEDAAMLELAELDLEE